MIEIGDRASAVDEIGAALDHHVRIAAEHEHFAREHRLEHVAEIVHRLARVVEQSGADDVIGGFQRREPDRQPVEYRHVALRSEVKDALLRPLAHLVMRHVAGGNDRVISLARHLQPRELPLHLRAWARRVGDEYDARALRACPHQRVAGRRKRLHAVMHHAPNVAEDEVVAGGEFGKM